MSMWTGGKLCIHMQRPQSVIENKPTHQYAEIPSDTEEVGRPNWWGRELACSPVDSDKRPVQVGAVWGGGLQV